MKRPVRTVLVVILSAVLIGYIAFINFVYYTEVRIRGWVEYIPESEKKTQVVGLMSGALNSLLYSS